MSCQRCKSFRMMDISAKTRELCIYRLGDKVRNGYIPTDIGITSYEDPDEDYIQFSYCLDCGQIQGKWPIDETCLEYNGENYA